MPRSTEQVDLQPASGGALAGAASEAAVAAVAEDLTARLPGVFDLTRARAAALAGEPGGSGGSGEPEQAGGLPPTWVALLQELERWNTVRMHSIALPMLCIERACYHATVRQVLPLPLHGMNVFLNRSLITCTIQY